MYIYTLFYKDTGLYNRSIFVMPNDATAKKAMKLNLMDTNAERFRNECATGDVELRKISSFNEDSGIYYDDEYTVCNLKDLLNDDNGNLETTEPDNT